jgi:hypothetical protein
MDMHQASQLNANIAGIKGCTQDAPQIRHPESGLRPSIKCTLEDRIKKHRDDAFALESLLRELPTLSHDADRAIWDMLFSTSAFR